MTLKEDISCALETLRSGGLILYPTDTIWGIGCDATSAEAVAKVYALKKRDEAKSLITLLDTDNKLISYVKEVPDVAYELIEYSEKPLTIIYDGAKNLASNLIASDGSVAIRIVNHPLCRELIQRFRKPIVSTSANISGAPPPANFAAISDEIKNGVDYTVKFGQDDLSQHSASTIMKLDASGKFSFIRR